MAHKILNSAKFLAERNHLAVVAAKFSCGAPRDGAQKGPQAVIDSGIFTDLQSKHSLSISIDDLNQTPSESDDTAPDIDGMKRPHAVSSATKRISEHVCQQAHQGQFVLTLGGDHSIGIGTVSGTAKAIRERFLGREMAVMWIDAHADINTPETSVSDRIHGMPVAFVSGLARAKGVFEWLEESHMINLKKFVYVGLRDVDDAEERIIAEHGIKAFTMEDVKQHGIQKVMDLALEYIGETPLHVSYDIDSLDPDWAPSTGFPVAPGLSLEEGVHISKRLHESGNLVAMDLVEINPDIAEAELDTTVQSGCSVIKSALGVDQLS